VLSFAAVGGCEKEAKKEEAASTAPPRLRRRRPAPAATNKLEGQLNIVAGRLHRAGETDKAYDWVTQYEKDTACSQRQNRRHVRRDGRPHDPGRLRPG